jgi:hypothetical protein
VAVLNSLRLGPLEEPRNRYLFGGIVKGVGDYGNCVGVPTLGGEVAFAPGYSGNPLVNAMCVGLLRERRGCHRSWSGSRLGPLPLARQCSGELGCHVLIDRADRSDQGPLVALARFAVAALPTIDSARLETHTPAELLLGEPNSSPGAEDCVSHG